VTVRPLSVVLALLGAVAAVGALAAQPTSVDAAFATLWQARTPREAAAVVDRIVGSGVTFDEAFRRLRQGRVYSHDVPRGVVQGSYRSDAGEYFYTLDVPATYDPGRLYQVRVQLHGGVGRYEDNSPHVSGPAGRLSGAEQIYLMPYAWRDAPWWSGRQTENLHAIIDVVKRAYNVDENRVVLSGVSDGGTGVYYTAMRDTTPFASFLPLNGFMMVLKNEMSEAEGDLFPNNLLNKPLFVVNGGRDPLYPTSVVGPYIEQLKKGGVDLEYRPQANAGHDTSWWPEIKDSFEAFVAAHPRRPLPDTLTWEGGPPAIPGRAHWLVVDRLAARRPDDPVLPDLNRRPTAPVPDFGIGSSGTQINRVWTGSNAAQIGLKSGDVVVKINSQPTSPGTDLAEVLGSYPPGRPLLITVARGGKSVALTGKYAPTVLPGQAASMFPPQRDSGRVDLTRAGNTVNATCTGVGAFTLLISPDQFDLNRAITVVVNGRKAFEGPVQKNVRSLLEWAARDNDRTMLFAAELAVEVPH
jgi:predicted esterase